MMLVKTFATLIFIYCQMLNVHGELDGGFGNRYFPMRKRPIDYFDKRYNSARSVLKKLKIEEKKISNYLLGPTNFLNFSKSYKKYLNVKKAIEAQKQLKSEGKSLSPSSQEYQILKKYEKEVNRRSKKKEYVEKLINSVTAFRQKKNMRYLRVKAQYNMPLQLDSIFTGVLPELMRSPYDNYWWERPLLDYYEFSWENLRYGLTLTEIEKLLVIISFIRFCFYTIKYDARSALIISITAFISAIFYQKMLMDLFSICYFRLYLSPTIFRAQFEQFLDFIRLQNRAPFALKMSSSPLDSLPWLRKFINDSPILSLLKEYLETNVIPTVITVIKLVKKPMEPLLFYTLVLRLGKEFVPYPLQWHGIIYLMYCQVLAEPMYNRYVASMEFLRDILIPQLRMEEIEVMELLQATYLTGLIYLIMLGMLHAIFSQYYYIPFVSPNVSAYVGKRPTDSIFSGGYCSWQDEQELFVPSKGDYKLWFGFLGKGPKDRTRKRPRPPKISIGKNLLTLLVGLLTFYIMWAVQPNNTESLRYNTKIKKLPLEYLYNIDKDSYKGTDYGFDSKDLETQEKFSNESK